MSDLQLGLIVVGIVVVAGVYGYNRFQELQLRRRVESRFAQRPDDVLMNDQAGGARSADGRIEPSVGTVPAEAVAPQAAAAAHEAGGHAVSASTHAPEPVHYRVPGAARSPAPDPARSHTPDPARSHTPDPARSHAPDPAPDAASHHAARTDQPPASPPAQHAASAAPEPQPQAQAAPPTSPIDFVCSVETREPIDAGALERFTKAVSAIGKPAVVYGWNARAAEWVSLPGPPGGAVTRVHAALQLADRGGAANRVQLSSLRDLALQFAERAGGSCRCDDIDQAAKMASDIDRFCSQVDISLGCNILPRSSGALSGTKMRGLLESAGFVLEPNGRFVLRSDDGAVLLSAEDIQGGALSAERLRSGPIAGLTLTMDVPRVANGVRVFERMIEIARHLAHALDAVVVDDNRAELTEAGLKVIRGQLKSVHTAMEAQGIPAGGPLAVRLFS